MQFLLLIYDQEKRWRNLDEAQRNSEHQEYGAFSREFAGSIRGGNALQPTSTAKTVRVRDGNAQVTDGPFAETKEQLAAITWWRRKIPATRLRSRRRFRGRVPDP